MEVLNHCGCSEIKVVYKNRNAGIEVYTARHPTHGLVAIKILDFAGESSLRMYQREGHIANSMQHPNICTVYEQSYLPTPTGYKYFIIMEQASGDLKTEMTKRKERNSNWSSECLLNMLQQAVSALEMAQKQGVCHRDLKPNNILIYADGRIKLADFGSARDHVQDSVVQTLSLQGTPIYLSPELRAYYVLPENMRASKLQYNPYKSDVYSLGLTFIHLIQLFPAMNLTKLEGLEEATRIQVENLQTTQHMKEILAAMLEKDEEMRPDFIMLKEIIDAMLNGGIISDVIEPIPENYLNLSPVQVVPAVSLPKQAEVRPSYPPPPMREDVLTPPNVLLPGVQANSALRLTAGYLEKQLPPQPSKAERFYLEEQPAEVRMERPVPSGSGSPWKNLKSTVSSVDLPVQQGTITIESAHSHIGDVEPEVGMEPFDSTKCVICQSELDSTALEFPCGHQFCDWSCLEVLMLDKLKYFKSGFEELMCPCCQQQISLEYLKGVKIQGMTINSYSRHKQNEEACMECRQNRPLRVLDCKHKICEKCMRGWIKMAIIQMVASQAPVQVYACSICKEKKPLDGADADFAASIVNLPD